MKIFSWLFTLLMLSDVFAQPYPKSDHFNGERFFNPELKQENDFWDVIKWKWTSDKATWEDSVPNKVYPAPVLAPNGKATITFINHATFLIQLPGMNILTDPLFSERASPFKFMGPKRVRAPGIALEQLPKIDVVIISHNHYDHLDLEALKIIDAKFHPLMLVPLGDKKLLLKAGIQNVVEMDWWQVQQVRETSIAFTPSQHWSARGLFDRHESLWGSFYISHNHFKIYFGGDTGYSTHFSQINVRLGSPDVALLPIGAYEPRWFMKAHHMNPEEAIRAHLDLGSKLSIGMHFGTVQLTDEGREQPIQELEISRAKQDIDPDQFIVLDNGETHNF